MNSKKWLKKALSTCLVVATMATYSMVALAGSGKAAGELLVSGTNLNGATPFVTVNGEAAQSGRSVFSSSTIATPENASAIINLGKVGKIELAPNTVLSLSFDDAAISGNLIAGKITVLNSAETVSINTGAETVKLNAGDSATNNGKAAPDDDTVKGGSKGSLLLYALILGGAAVAIIIAASTNNNDINVSGGGITVISPTR